MERRLSDLLGTTEPIHVPNELAESKYLQHYPVNSGPEYLMVHASSWDHPYTEHGPIKNLAEARDLAHSKGLKGISVVFGEDHAK